MNRSTDEIGWFRTPIAAAMLSGVFVSIIDICLGIHYGGIFWPWQWRFFGFGTQDFLRPRLLIELLVTNIAACGGPFIALRTVSASRNTIVCGVAVTIFQIANNNLFYFIARSINWSFVMAVHFFAVAGFIEIFVIAATFNKEVRLRHMILVSYAVGVGILATELLFNLYFAHYEQRDVISMFFNMITRILFNLGVAIPISLAPFNSSAAPAISPVASDANSAMR